MRQLSVLLPLTRDGIVVVIIVNFVTTWGGLGAWVCGAVLRERR